jgi:hypothetical protein
MAEDGPTDPHPDDPITAAINAAGQLRAMYLAFAAAGFTEEQSLRLVMAMFGTRTQ